MSLLQFKTVTLCDKSWVDPIVMAENSPSADYNFGNIYIWDKFYKQLICRFEDRMITKLRYEGERAFVFPIGSGPLRPAIEALRAFCKEKGYPLLLRGVTEKHCQELEDAFPGHFTFELEENLADYIYSAESSPPTPARRSTGRRITATASKRSTTGTFSRSAAN